MGGGSYVFIESGSHTNAQLTARSNVGDFTLCFCRKGANIMKSGGAD